jgi:hypothetical protein
MMGEIERLYREMIEQPPQAQRGQDLEADLATNDSDGDHGVGASIAALAERDIAEESKYQDDLTGSLSSARSTQSVDASKKDKKSGKANA